MCSFVLGKNVFLYAYFYFYFLSGADDVSNLLHNVTVFILYMCIRFENGFVSFSISFSSLYSDNPFAFVPMKNCFLFFYFQQTIGECTTKVENDEKNN